MELVPIGGFDIHSLAGQECQLIKGVPAEKSFRSFDSVKGRAFCVIAIPLHLVGAVIKPVIYAVGAVLSVLAVAVSLLVLPIFLCRGGDHKWDMLSMSCKILTNCVINLTVSAPLQLFLALKASFGVIDPKMYFTKNNHHLLQPKWDDVFKPGFTLS